MNVCVVLKRLVHGTALLLAMLLLANCQVSKEQASIERFVVITEEDVAHHRQLHPEYTLSEARRTLDQEAKLAQLALEQPQARLYARLAVLQAKAKQQIATSIESPFRREAISEKIIQQAYDAYAFEIGQPQRTTVTHLLLRTKTLKDTELARARQTMSRVRQWLSEQAFPSDQKMAQAVRALMLDGYLVAFDRRITFPTQPIEPFLGMPGRYMNVVEPFAVASAQLSHKRPLSAIVETTFGYHIIRFDARMASTRIPYQQVKPFLIEQILKYSRQVATQQYLDALRKKHNISFNDNAIHNMLASEK